MKISTINRSTSKTYFLFVVPLISCGFFLGGMSPAKAGEVFSTDFSKGTFDALGWTVKGDWTIADYGADKPGLANNPGPVAKFPAKGTTDGTLTKTFGTIANPSSLTLTFDAGYGWGAKDHSQSLQVMLLDADGNGYVFDIHRANMTWGAQWAPVAKYVHSDTLNWAPAAIDTTQPAVVNGGGLRTFTITRDSSGKWTFDSAGWTGGPLIFTDTTTSSFSQVVLSASPNTDDLLFGKIKLEASK